jgi:hypothetical protein
MYAEPDEQGHLPQSLVLSRRTFVASAAALLGGATAVLVPEAPSVAAERASTPAKRAASRAPVVSFHMDRPYLDPTGTAQPYHPPAGLRSGQAMADLSEAEFLSRHAYRC